MASFHALIPCTSLSTPNPTAKSIQQLSTFNNGIGSYLFSCHSHKIRGGCKFSWNFTKRFNLYASLSSNGNGLEAAAAASKEFEDDEFIVVNFYRFVFIKDPEEEVSKHLHFMKVSLSLSLYLSIFISILLLLVFLVEFCIAFFCNLSPLMLLSLWSAASLPTFIVG